MAKVDDVVNAIRGAQETAEELLHVLNVKITESNGIYIEVVSERDLEQVPGEAKVIDLPDEPGMSYLEKQYNGAIFRYKKWDFCWQSA